MEIAFDGVWPAPNPRSPFYITGPAIISFSGGRTSAYMLFRILEAHGGTLPDDVYVVFANTGREMPATLDFVAECGARFATMLPALVERCVKAGSRPGDNILDPFGGAGTTGLVADRLGRRATLIELNLTYVALAVDRLAADAPLLAEVNSR